MCNIFFARLKKKIRSDDYIRYILCRYYGYDFEKIDIDRTQNGKPYIKDSRWKYNISHTKDIIVAVVSEFEVGVDIEVVRKIDVDRMMNRFFHKEEIDFINSSQDKNIEFFRIWTKKEAYIKKNALNLTYVSKINVLNEDIYTFDCGDVIMSICV